jgi:hypothetical protein
LIFRGRQESTRSCRSVSFYQCHHRAPERPFCSAIGLGPNRMPPIYVRSPMLIRCYVDREPAAEFRQGNGSVTFTAGNTRRISYFNSGERMPPSRRRNSDCLPRVAGLIAWPSLTGNFLSWQNLSSSACRIRARIPPGHPSSAVSSRHKKYGGQDERCA